MRRLPLVAFGALVVATVGAFFVTQHLKVSTPLVAGSPHPAPNAISPNGTGCDGLYRVARFSFYLLHRADDVAVYIVDRDGTIVRTIASSRHMPRKVRESFPWNGREDNGRIAPDGKYYFRIALLHQGRTVELTRTPVAVKTTPPRPVVSSVSPALIPQGDGADATISYRGTEGRGAVLRIYRTDLPGDPQVKQFKTKWGASSAIWDGTIHGRPAPAGTYLTGLAVQDKACNVGSFPVTIPPPRGLTPHAGVTVRYLAAQPPLDPVRSGSTAVVYVDSRQHPYRWALRRAGSKKVLRHGSGHAVALHVRVPDAGAGLYELAVRSGSHRTVVPLVVSRSHSQAKMLVVLPALTWQGENPVDDDGDGIPNTLTNGGPIALHRPLVSGLGLPQGFLDEAGFVSYLDGHRLPYDLTTDVGLIDGAGPALTGHRGVVFAGSERWLPASLNGELRDYVRDGGHVVSLGIDSLRRSVTVSGARASGPGGPAATDIFGARIGRILTRNHDFILVGHDGMRIFSTTSGAFSGYRSFQQFAGVAPPAGSIASVAGTSTSTDSIIGFPLGRGTVVEIGLIGFGSSLAHNTDAQELVRRLWTVSSG